MTTTAQASETTDSNTSQPMNISNPDISFADYQTLRRGGKVEARETTAPEANTSVQKKPSGSESEGLEAKPETENEDDLDNTDDSSDSDQKTKPKKGGFQRKIDKLYGRVAERDRLIADRDREIERLKALASNGAGKSNEQKTVENKSDTSGEPDPDNFESHKEYVKAMAKWTLEEDKKAAKAEEEKNKLKSDYEKAQSAHYDREKAFADKTPDYLNVMREFLSEDPNAAPAFHQAIVESDHGPEIMYMLAKDPKEFERINSLSASGIWKEIGKIESKFSATATNEAKQEIKKVTKAPEPIVPVGGSKGSVSKSISDPDISFADYERIRREQQRKKGR